MSRKLERSLKALIAFLLRRILAARTVSIPSSASFTRILVVRQHNQLGDMLCAVPFLRALRERYPEAQIALLASPVSFEVMAHNRYVDSIINFDKREFLGKGVGGLLNLRRFVNKIRDLRPDLALVPSTVSLSFTSDFLSYISGARYRVGPISLNGKENATGFLYNVPIVLNWTEEPLKHQTLRTAEIARPLEVIAKNLELEITFDQNEVELIKQLQKNKLRRNRKLIVYHVGAGKPSNRWDVLRFAQTAEALRREFDSVPILTNGPMDDGPVNDMIRLLPDSYELVKGKTIREVAAILSTVDLLITNDTGIMHVGAAVGVPVLSLFGPTQPEQWAPIGPQHRWLRGAGGEVNNIAVEDVLTNAREMLQRK